MYLLTPFIGGGDMFDWVLQQRRLPEEVAKPLFRQLLEGTGVSQQRLRRWEMRDLEEGH